MRLQVAFLCDALEITDKNLFNAYNGGITAIRFKKLPDIQYTTFVLAIEYIQSEESGKHTIEIRIIDGDGRDRMKPERIDALFHNDCNTYNLWLELSPKFYKYEMHNVIITVDGCNLASLQLDILPDKPPEIKHDRKNIRFRIREDGTVLLNSGSDGRKRIDLYDNEKPIADKLKLRYENICKAKKYADRLGLMLRELQTNDKLELYFDVYRDTIDKSICYLSKGWNDPGYRIGERIVIDKEIAGFKEKFYKMLNICADNLIAVKVFPVKKNKVELNLQVGIYRDGFNDKVLSEAIDSLEDSLQKIRQLL